MMLWLSVDTTVTLASQLLWYEMTMCKKQITCSFCQRDSKYSKQNRNKKNIFKVSYKNVNIEKKLTVIFSWADDKKKFGLVPQATASQKKWFCFSVFVVCLKRTNMRYRRLLSNYSTDFVWLPVLDFLLNS